MHLVGTTGMRNTEAIQFSLRKAIVALVCKKVCCSKKSTVGLVTL